MTFLDLTEDSESGVKAGDYEVSVESAELKDTKAGTGKYIKIKLEATTGEIFFHNFNIENPNPKAVQIGRGQLKKFLRVAGKAEAKLGDVSELVGLRCVIKVGIRKDEAYGEQADIKDFKPAKPVSAF